jgi:hypothetical protein
VGYQSTFTYELNAETDRLLSLSGHHWQFTGGAHGNGGASPLLWDKALSREIPIVHMFSRPSEYSLLGPRYCAELDKERRKRRGGDGKLGTIDEFDQCPKFSDLSVELIDDNENRRFDHLQFTADPYVAGPYSEGEYVIDLPVTPHLIGAIKPEYRSSFEVQRQ